MKKIYTDEEKRIRAKISRRKWKINNKKYLKKYAEIHKEEIIKWRKQYRERRIKNWIGIIPEVTYCQICNKKIYLCSTNKENVICFDHKKENLNIIKPAEWLRNHKKIPENQKIWEECDFGMLCGKCNRCLPTKNRKEFLKKVIKYVWRN